MVNVKFIVDFRGILFRFSAAVGVIWVLQNVKTGSGSHPVSWSLDTEMLFEWGTAAGG
jgi:hypothetical protein